MPRSGVSSHFENLPDRRGAEWHPVARASWCHVGSLLLWARVCSYSPSRDRRSPHSPGWPLAAELEGHNTLPQSSPAGEVRQPGPPPLAVSWFACRIARETLTGSDPDPRLGAWSPGWEPGASSEPLRAPGSSSQWEWQPRLPHRVSMFIKCLSRHLACSKCSVAVVKYVIICFLGPGLWN